MLTSDFSRITKEAKLYSNKPWYGNSVPVPGHVLCAVEVKHQGQSGWYKDSNANNRFLVLDDNGVWREVCKLKTCLQHPAVNFTKLYPSLCTL